MDRCGRRSNEVVEVFGKETAVENVSAVGEEVIGLKSVSTVEGDGRKLGIL